MPAKGCNERGARSEATSDKRGSRPPSHEEGAREYYVFLKRVTVDPSRAARLREMTVRKQTTKHNIAGEDQVGRVEDLNHVDLKRIGVPELDATDPESNRNR